MISFIKKEDVLGVRSFRGLVKFTLKSPNLTLKIKIINILIKIV